ncbi:hypothetical protein B0H67DRAFT_591538 [Lasiosphaeris hirsuta]|uniref:Uncharacterized protein n=1 Tax=Lasiosphaeris hirsuta TaxID=260670 RepID=A0AA39ZVW5_9PEZI|nr:hypothetical protein B0H67DRAFT_591538 [Lasiosphaeris hirsuta]
MPTPQENTLYITLQYLRTVQGVRKYHWALYCTGSTPPAGYLVHATDTNRAPLDLYKDVRRVSDPRRSGSLVVVLKISHSPGIDAIEFCADAVRLMDRRHLPSGESQWTCRVWVKEVLATLRRKGYIRFPADLDTIEERCQDMADRNIAFMGNARIFNDLSWIDSDDHSRDSLMEIDALQPAGRGSTRHYGPSPMVIDSTGSRYYSSKPMIIDSSSGCYYG